MKIVNRKFALIWVIFIIALSLNAQETETESVQNIFMGTRFVNGQSVNLADEGELNLQIQHRFGDISGGFYEFFGLDLAAMRLGFEYGLFNNFNVGIGRSNILKTYDLNLKLRLVKQTNNFPVTIVLTSEGSLPTERDLFPEEFDNFSGKHSVDVQLHLAKTIGIFAFQVSPGYLHTGYLFANNNKFDLATLGLGASVKVSKKVAVNIEYLHHFEENITTNKPLSLGVDLSTSGHLFQLLISNSQGMNNHALFTNTFGDWSDGNIYFGFNLIRKFRLKYTDEFY